MKLEIIYFGMLAELTSCKNEEIEFKGNTAKDLTNLLFNKHPLLNKIVFRIAQQNKLINLNDKITNSEVSVFPPFAGG